MTPPIKPNQLARRITPDELQAFYNPAYVEFAKYGFRGTLTIGLSGVGLLFVFALLQAFTPFELETWGYVAIATLIVIGCIAFGAMSLGELPKIEAKFKGIGFHIEGDDGE